jgi:hypothetical protein
MPNTPRAVQEHLAEIVATKAPSSLLLIGLNDEDALALAAAAPNGCRPVCLSPEEVADYAVGGERFELAVLLHTLEYQPDVEGKRLLGRLRDMLASCVIVGVADDRTATTDWTIADFIALGFRRSPGSRDLAPGWALYRHDIHDYKTTPSWLSSRYWANPQRWGKERW